MNENKIYKEYKNKMKISPVIQQGDSTNAVVYSFDLETSKFSYELKKNGEPFSLATASDVSFVLRFGGSNPEEYPTAILIGDVEDRLNGKVSFVMPKRYLGFDGRVLGEVNIQFTNGQSLTAGHFSFVMKPSYIDEGVEIAQRVYVERFEDLEGLLKETSEAIKNNDIVTKDDLTKVQSGFLGEFNSVAELKSKYPNGTNGYAVVFENSVGYTYTYKNDVWTKGNVWNGMAIADNSLNINKMDYEVQDAISISKNTEQTLDSLYNSELMYCMKNIVRNGSFLGLNDWLFLQGAIGNSNKNVLKVTSDGSNANAIVRQIFEKTQTGKFYLDFTFKTSSTTLTEVSVYVGNKIFTLRPSNNPGSAIPFVLNKENRIQVMTDSIDVDRLSFVFRFGTGENAKSSEVELSKIMLINASESFGTEISESEIKKIISEHNIYFFGGNYYIYKESNDEINANALTIDDFGAKADGVTDNYEAFMKAIEATDEIVIPKCDIANGKKYTLARTVVVPSGKTIKGYGPESLVQISNTRNLTATKWRDGMEDFYPAFITESGSSHVRMYNFRLQGSGSKEEERIEVGIAYYETTFGEMKGVEVDRINYFPKKAPTRPSGQWRRGWNVLTMRAENIEISYCDIQHGAYECLRVGDYSKRINIHHNVLKYGWRTVLQPLRGCEDIDINDNDIVQDDLGYCDTHAALTFHSSEGNTMKNIRLRRNKIRAKLFLDQPNGGSAISTVDIHHQDYLFEDNDIESNGYGISYNGYGTVSYVRNKIRSVLTGIPMNSKGIEAINLIDNDIKSETQSCVSLNNSSDVPLKKLKYRGNTLETSDTARAIIFGGTTEISGGLITENHFVNAKSPMVLTPNTSKMLVSMNDFTGAKEAVQDLGKNNMIINNIEND